MFVCHGNICRSPMAEFIFKDLAKKKGIADRFLVASSATSTEEIWNGIGNPVYPPVKVEFEKYGLSCNGKRAVQWAGEEYLLAEVVDSAELTPGGKVYDKETLFWSGYLYRFWHFATGENSREIYKQASAETMNRNWLIFHTLAPEVAIEDLKEIHRQRNEKTDSE